MRKLFLLLACVVTIALTAAENDVRVYNRTNGGFVIVEGEDIIGFSDHGTFATLPDNARGFLRSVGLSEMPVVGVAPKTIEEKLQAASDVEVGPLLGNIAFDQDVPYNNETPVYKGYHCPTGCVATAMVQIMAYYKFPKECHGSVSYKTPTLNITINKDLEGYKPDWSNMLPVYAVGEYNDAQAKAVADLMYAAGVSVEMDYNSDGSGAFSDNVAQALASHFDYDMEVERKLRSEYTDTEWHNLLQSELNAGRPMYYSSTQQEGAGHAYVCDGYQIKAGYEKYPYYHFNWGWGGSANGWFQLSNLRTKITQDGEELDIRFNQAAIIHIAPKGTLPIDNVYNVNENAPIYDILGREVTETLPGHLYIQNGYKIFVR